MPTDWADKVRAAITNLDKKTDRVLEPSKALGIIDDIVEGKLAADELAMIHGIPEAWIEVTLGHITRTAQGAGRVLPPRRLFSRSLSTMQSGPGRRIAK